MNMIRCEKLTGGHEWIARDRIVFRPSVYALLVHDGKILLMNTRHSGKLFLPGGGIEVGEPMLDALKREVHEETGLEIEVGELFYFTEVFFYHDPEDYAFQALAFVYRCSSTTTALIADELVDDFESEKPRWIDIDRLHEDDFQSFVKEVFLRLLATSDPRIR